MKIPIIIFIINLCSIVSFGQHSQVKFKVRIINNAQCDSYDHRSDSSKMFVIFDSYFNCTPIKISVNNELFVYDTISSSSLFASKEDLGYSNEIENICLEIDGIIKIDLPKLCGYNYLKIGYSAIDNSVSARYFCREPIYY